MSDTDKLSGVECLMICQTAMSDLTRLTLIIPPSHFRDTNYEARGVELRETLSHSLACLIVAAVVQYGTQALGTTNCLSRTREPAPSSLAPYHPSHSRSHSVTHSLTLSLTHPLAPSLVNHSHTHSTPTSTHINTRVLTDSHINKTHVFIFITHREGQCS